MVIEMNSLAHKIVAVIVTPVALLVAVLLTRFAKRWIGYLVEGILYACSRYLRHTFASMVSLRRYCRIVLADGNTRYMHVPSRQDIKLDVDGAFVPLTWERPGSADETYDPATIVARGSRVRVIGDPGSGKSSLVKRLLRDACNSGLLDARQAPLPVLYELKNLTIPGDVAADSLGDWFCEMLRSRVAKMGVYRMDECWDACASASGVLVLLDGLDEIATPSFVRAASAINQLGERLTQLGPNNCIVLTMRDQFHQQVRSVFDQQYPIVLRLKPFTPTDIYEFLNRWPFVGNAARHAARIYEDLTNRATLRDLCRNPLVLSMYVAEDQAPGTLVAPESRTGFYSIVTNELLIRRRLKQTGALIAPSKLKAQRERILGRIAYEHLMDETQPANSLRWEDAVAVVSDVSALEYDAAEAALRDLSKETGLFTEERQGETFRFIHLTFCEFLAAYEAVRGRLDGWPALLAKHAALSTNQAPQLRSRLLELIPFACALRIPRDLQVDSIREVSGLGDSRLLGRVFFETKLYEIPAWLAFARAEERTLYETPEASRDDEWLRELHLFTVVNRDAAASASALTSAQSVDLVRFFRSLIQEQHENLSQILSAYASTDAAAAFALADIARIDLPSEYPSIVVDNCDQRPFLALVREKATWSIGDSDTWLPLLAEAALRSSAVAGWLREQTPLNAWRRRIAMLERRRRWFADGFAAESQLTQCITLALAGGELSSACILLRAIARFPYPSAKSYLRTVGAILPFAIYIPATAIVMLGDPRVSSIATALGATCLTLLFVTMPIVRLIGWQTAYRIILYQDKVETLRLDSLIAQVFARIFAAGFFFQTDSVDAREVVHLLLARSGGEGRQALANLVLPPDAREVIGEVARIRSTKLM
jgi:NACHT domain